MSKENKDGADNKVTVEVGSEEFNNLVFVKVAEEVEGLKNKNNELLGKVNKYKDVDLEEYDDLKKSKESKDREKENGEGDVEAIRERIENEAATKIAAAEEKAEKAVSVSNKRTIDADLSKAIGDAKIAPELASAVKALIKSEFKVEVSDGKAVIDGKDATDFLKSWASSDKGKVYVSASGSSGGGGTGGQGSKAATVKTKQDLKNVSEKSAYIKEHGSEAFAKLPHGK